MKRQLKREFEMADFDEANRMLCLQINRNLEVGWLELDQKRCIGVILDRFGMKDCKGVVTPLEANRKYLKSQEATIEEEVKAMEEVPYIQAIGSLMYLMVSTRRDIARSKHMFSKDMQNPGLEHLARSGKSS